MRLVPPSRARGSAAQRHDRACAVPRTRVPLAYDSRRPASPSSDAGHFAMRTCAEHIYFVAPDRATLIRDIEPCLASTVERSTVPRAVADPTVCRSVLGAVRRPMAPHSHGISLTCALRHTRGRVMSENALTESAPRSRTCRQCSLTAQTCPRQTTRGDARQLASFSDAVTHRADGPAGVLGAPTQHRARLAHRKSIHTDTALRVARHSWSLALTIFLSVNVSERDYPQPWRGVATRKRRVCGGLGEPLGRKQAIVGLGAQ
jgi:hypothetical protein